MAKRAARTPKPIAICDDTAGHVWADPFHDGDTCACGRFYLDLHSARGFVAVVTEHEIELED